MTSFIHTFSLFTSSSFAQIKANAYVYKQLIVQARLMSYVDVFALFALLAFILIPVSFMLNTNVNEKDALEHQKHHHV